MIFLKLILASVFAFGSEIQIDDPNQYLSRLQGDYEFSAAFECPSSALVYSELNLVRVSCSSTSCVGPVMSANKQSTLFAEDCSSTGLKLYSDQGVEFSVSAEEYTKAGNNWISTFLKQTGQFFSTAPDRVKIEHVIPMMIEIVQNGEKRKVFVDAIWIAYEFQPGTMTFGMTLYADPKAKGLDQILLLNTQFDTIYRRKGVIGGPIF